MTTWEQLPLGTLAKPGDFIDGPFGSNLKASEYIDSGVPVLRLQNVRVNYFESQNIKFISERKANDLKRHTYQTGDVVITKLGDPCGVACQVPEGVDSGIVVADVLRFRSSDQSIDHRYLVHYLNSLGARRQVAKLAKGTTRQRVNLSDFKKVIVPLPSLAEQRRIAAILDKADAVRRKRKEAIALTEDLLSSAFLEMFGNSSNMELVALEKLAAKKKHALSSGPFGSNLTSSHYLDKGVLVLRGKNITGGKIDLSDVKYVSEEKAEALSRSSIKSGDVMIVAVGSSGAALSIPDNFPQAIMSQNFNKITPDHEKVDSLYLEYAINSDIVQNQLAQNITDTVRTFLSLTKLRKILIPLPNIALQREFAACVAHIRTTQERYIKNLTESENLFNSLLQRAFRGDL